MHVSDVMTRDVVTVEAGGTVQDAVGAMLDDDIGSVVVTSDGTPAGLVTETDVLTAGYRTESAFPDIALDAVMSQPVKTVARDVTVRKASAKMDEHGIKKLPVMDGIELIGIVTLTDIVRNVSEIGDRAPDDVGEYFSDPV